MSNSASDTNTPPDILYHYTTQSGLLGIIESNSIRATDIFYLNDATEYNYALNLMLDKINELTESLPPKKTPTFALVTGSHRPAKKDINQIKHEFLEEIQKILQSFKQLNTKEFFSIFVCSFSQKGDHLGQWRGYCPNGNGFSIGFNREKLTALMKKGHFNLVKCIYEKKAQIKIIAKIFNISLKELESKFQKEGKITELFDSAFETAFNLIETAPKFKDVSFKDEKEWRFIARIDSKSKKIRYRKGMSMITPYISIELLNESISTIPITHLIVGPTPHKELASTSVKAMLINKVLTDCEFTSSKIPYRAW